MLTLIPLFLAMILPGPFAQVNQGKPRTPPCISGSCTLNFVGVTGTTLPVWNTALVNLTSGVPCNHWNLYNGAGIITIGPTAFDLAGCILTSSTAEYWQMTQAATTANIQRWVTVNSVSNTQEGNSVSFGFPFAGNWTAVVIRINGSSVDQINGSWPQNVDHILGVYAVPGSLVGAYVDGVDIGNKTVAAVSGGSPAWFMAGTGTDADNHLGPGQDHH